jgi:GntR family transcriptional regulator, transcriptional repressor for pyruvate dehydrogenase complex
LTFEKRNYAMQRISDIVFKNIEEKILSGEWKPGTKIMSEPQLAKELNVSRVSVREAIEKMVALDILKKVHGGGTYVNDITPSTYFNSLIPMILLTKDNYLEILEFRLLMEVESTRLCTLKCDNSLIEELQQCYTNMIEYKDDIDKFTIEDLRFHTLIVSGSGNSLLIKVYNILMHLLEYHHKTLFKNLGPYGGIADHLNILDSIKSRDSELAALLAKRHIERTIRDVTDKGIL